MLEAATTINTKTKMLNMPLGHEIALFVKREGPGSRLGRNNKGRVLKLGN
jgi:hypothetical protein